MAMKFQKARKSKDYYLSCRMQVTYKYNSNTNKLEHLFVEEIIFEKIKKWICMDEYI